eukprot:497409-Hanusia_phi.AAC.1
MARAAMLSRATANASDDLSGLLLLSCSQEDDTSVGRRGREGAGARASPSDLQVPLRQPCHPPDVRSQAHSSPRSLFAAHAARVAAVCSLQLELLLVRPAATPGRAMSGDGGRRQDAYLLADEEGAGQPFLLAPA